MCARGVGEIDGLDSVNLHHFIVSTLQTLEYVRKRERERVYTELVKDQRHRGSQVVLAILTLSLPQPVKFHGLKNAGAHLQTVNIFPSYNKSFSILFVLMKVLSQTNAKKKKKFTTFIGRFRIAS